VIMDYQRLDNLEYCANILYGVYCELLNESDDNPCDRTLQEYVTSLRESINALRRQITDLTNA
jgi:hypothetical protein